MALLKCGECGRDVSSKAAACPNCGARPSVPKSSRLKTLFIVFLVVVALAFINAKVFGPRGAPSQTPSSSQPTSASQSSSPPTAPIAVAGGLDKLAAHIRKDSANRPTIDAPTGVRNWTYRDIINMSLRVATKRLTVSTNWFPKETNSEPARRMCKYIASMGHMYDFERVVVEGQGGQALATCEAWQ